MNPQISSSPTPKKVAFSPVRLGPSNTQSRPGTPPSNGKTGTPRSILKTTSSPVKYNPENEVSVVLDSSSVISIANRDGSGTSLDTFIQRLLVTKDEERLHAYSSFYGALKQEPNTENVTEAMTRSALETCLKDMECSESIVIKQTSVRCIGFILHYNSLVGKLGASDVSSALNSIVKTLNETQAKSIYTLCIWCLAMQRVTKRILDPHVPLITKAAISALNPRLKSAKAQMEALTALDIIFTQDTSRWATWASCCFITIVQCLTHSISPLRRKAAVILTKMLPKSWSEPTILNSSIQIFLRDHAVKFTEEMTKLIEEAPEDHDIMQIWALMIMVMGTNLHRSRFLNGMIRVAEKSFQCRRSDSNINTFKAWSSLIYNFRLNNHLLHESRLKLVKLPLEAGLKEEKHVSVRIAATRTWISLVYACNDDFNQAFVFNAIIRDFVLLLSKDKSPVVLDMLFNTLAALMGGHNRKVNRISLVNVFFRGMDLQATDVLPISPNLIRDHQLVIIEALKASVGHAVVKLDNRSDLTIKKSYMETWQALIRTYRNFYQKEIRPSSAYIDAIHTCLRFLAFVILGADNSRSGFKDRLFVFKHLLKAMMDILSPDFLTLRPFELSLDEDLFENGDAAQPFKQKKYVPIVYCLSIFVAGISSRPQEAYEEYVETICELSGACRQSSESFLDFIALLESDFVPIYPTTSLEQNTREGLFLKLKMASSCIRHELGSLHGAKCLLPETDEIKQVLGRLLCYPLTFISKHAELYSYILLCKHSERMICNWLGLFNSIANLIPNCMADIARYLRTNIDRILYSDDSTNISSSVICWLDFCMGQLAQISPDRAKESVVKPDVLLEPANRPSILLAMLPVQEQVAKTIQYELDPVERLPELAAALNHYLSNVLKCISLSHIDVKTRVAVAIKHLSCFEKALSDSETSVPGGIKLYVIDFMSSIMVLLEQWPVDDQTVESWAQCTSNLINSQDPAISRPFIEKVKLIKRQRSCPAVLQSASFASIFETIAQGERNIKSAHSSPTRLHRRLSNASMALSPKNVSRSSPSDATLTSPTINSSNNSQYMVVDATLQDTDSLSTSQQADQFSNTAAISQDKPSTSSKQEPMILDVPTSNDLTRNGPHHSRGDNSRLAAYTENSPDSLPDGDNMREGSSPSDTISPRHQIDRSTDQQATPTRKTPSKIIPESKTVKTLSLASIVDWTTTKANTPPTNKRTWTHVNDDIAVVDLTTSPKKRTKSDECDKSDESIACSPQPSIDIIAHKSLQYGSMPSVTSLLEKAIEERTELEQMTVSDLLSCQKLLNQLNVMITDSLSKSMQ
ncbi:Rap1-interacting factor 1 N terminal-domain-containing protein [Umbelopsis sp. PMI_123]|nr:Rap1-interacting factor 1 N terminal-domain-containing protein [Umbelopsis sp. PMI_123]